MNVWEQVLAQLYTLGERHDSLAGKLDAINEKLETIMSDQATEAQFAQQVETDVAAINQGVQTALTEVAALQQAIANGIPPAALDWSALTQALTDLGTATSGVAQVDTAAEPATPASS